ncbi:MAG TPA: Lrp/AsnC family transcriptional regulator [Flavobacteriia bacterium]|nr:Lrp/AsnC family transcriptional regulator [Flavobacteriia bacterium]
MVLDSIDKSILNLLQENAKITTKKLSEKLHLSTTAIYERIKKMEKNNIISKYVVVLNPIKVHKNFVVLCQVKLVQHNHKLMQLFEKEVKQLKEVLECYNISGDYDYQLKVVVENMQAYRTFLNTKLTTLDYIGSTYSTFIISKVKESSKIEL